MRGSGLGAIGAEGPYSREAGKAREGAAMEISSSFDGGKVGVVSAERTEDIRLKILPDNAADFAQWFFFRLTGARRQAATLSFPNAGAASEGEGTSRIPDSWEADQ